jgi:hypothetical protein
LGDLVQVKGCVLAAVLAVLMVVVVTAPAAAVGPPTAARIAAADCSETTATQLVNDNDLNGFLLPKPVVQVLCGPFTGPGSEAMAVTIGAATCWSPQSWALFNSTGGSWQLVHLQPAFLIGPLVAVGADIRETTPIFRSGDPRCIPSGGSHARVWHWDGAHLVAGPWKQVKKGKSAKKPTRSTSRTSATFYSPSKNASCEMNDGRPGVGSYVYCQTWKRPQSVKLGLDGRLKICHDTSTTTTHCLGNPGERTPVLAYGKQITLKHFRCRSEQAGVTCTVIKSGKGFRIDRTGVRRVG